MKVMVKDENGVTVVMVSGEVDAVTCGGLQEKLDKLLDSGRSCIVLDFHEVTYISSAGLRVILGAAQRLYGKGKLAISRTPDTVRSVLEMVGLANIMALCPSIEEALAVVKE